MVDCRVIAHVPDPIPSHSRLFATVPATSSLSKELAGSPVTLPCSTGCGVGWHGMRPASAFHVMTSDLFRAIRDPLRSVLILRSQFKPPHAARYPFI